jgi:DNA-binding NarL/FixJ family response regulator
VSARWPLTARAGCIERLARAYTERVSGGVVLTGPAGVGKTRIGEELLVLSGSRPRARAVGHTATQSIPLGAFAHLLPAEMARDIGLGDDDRVALFHQARVALSELAGGERLLLLVDDIDQLDDTSLALLVPLTLQRTLFLVATVRAGRPLPAVVETLVKDGHLGVEEILPLAHDEVVTLLHRVLDGPVETASCERLAEVSAGNLQVLHEVVGLAQQRGVLRVDSGAWRLAEVPVPRALDELVRSRVEGVDAPRRRALDLLAIAGNLPLDDLVALAGNMVVERLDAEQTIRVTLAGTTPVVSLAHPMYGEVLRGQLGVLEERSRKRELADAFERRRASAPEDLSRMAAWRLDSGGHVDAPVLLTAARLSLMGRDAGSAIRFATAAAEAGAAHDASRVLIEAAVLRSDPARIEAAAAAVWDDDDLPDAHRAHLSRRVALARFALGDDDGALAIITDAAQRVCDAPAVAAVHAARAEILATMGRPHDTLDVLDASAGVGDDDPRVQVQRNAARSIAATSLGRYQEAAEAARAGAAAQGKLPEWLARRGMATHLVNEAHALGYAGHFAAARALVEPALAAAVDAGSLAAQLWFHVVLGEVWRDAGYGRRALSHFERAVALAEPAHQRASLVWSWVGIAQGRLLLGEADAAAFALAEADAVDSPLATSTTTRDRTRAWLLAARGDLTAARTLVTRVADAAAADGMLGFETSARHDLVRFGAPHEAVDRLAELAQVVEGPWIAALSAHASASVADDPAVLEAAVDGFEEMDTVTYAAEAAAELAAMHRRHGDPRAANAAERRAQLLAERAGGARTPALSRGSALVPLTTREHEVALLAAQGLTSGDIAHRLVLSTRTVDTHLARVYRKLGIGGRDELATALVLRT